MPLGYRAGGAPFRDMVRTHIPEQPGICKPKPRLLRAMLAPVAVTKAQSDQMEIARMSLELVDSHACQHDLVVVGVGDDRIKSEIGRLCAV
jgi:hypothetical protein